MAGLPAVLRLAGMNQHQVYREGSQHSSQVGPLSILILAILSMPAARALASGQGGENVVYGETTVTTVPMVKEAWGATAGPVPTGAKKVHPIGHYPGFQAAKAFANQVRLQKQPAGSRNQAATAGRRQLQQGPLQPSQGLVFGGPNETQTNYFPPDSQLAAGPNYVVVAVNSLLAIYDKSGNLQGSFQDFQNFFSGLGLTGNIFDPRIIYDQADGRFILSAAEVDETNFTNGHVLLAVSETSDPTGNWYKYALDSGGTSMTGGANTFPDFPNLGLSSAAVYISTNQFAVNSNCLSTDSCSFSDAWIQVVGLPALLSGSAQLNITVFKNILTSAQAQAFAIAPALTYGSSSQEFLIAAAMDANPSTLLNVFSIPTSGTVTLTEADLTVPSFSEPPDASQKYTTTPIATNDARLLNAVWIGGSLWCGQNVQATNGSPVAQWYQISATSLSSLAIQQSGQISGYGDAYFPAIMADSNGNATVAFSTSSSNFLPSAALTGRSATDPSGVMRGFGVYEQGTDNYADIDTRWGDYSGISPDPGGVGVWAIAEYAQSPDPNYGTSIANISGPPALGIAPASLSFPAQPYATASSPLDITLTNNGTGTLTFNSLTLSDTQNFSIASSTCTAPLAAGANCVIGIVFLPLLPGTISTTFQIDSSGTGQPNLSTYVPISGVTLSGVPQLSSSTITFPNTALGTPSAAQTVTFSNAGNAPMTLGSIQVSGPFTQTNNCPATLSAGQSCTISIVFIPTSMNNYQGFLDVEVQDPIQGGEIVTANLLGSVVAAPGVVLCPATLNFGNQPVGTPSAPQTVIITNSGSAGLTLTNVAAAGDFSVNNNCGATPVAPRASCTVSVTFNPSTAGARTGSLTFTDNSTDSPQTVVLSGTGVTSTSHLLHLPVPRSLAPALLALGNPAAMNPPAPPAGRRSLAPGPTLANTQAANQLKNLPLHFEPVPGRSASDSRFLARTREYSVLLTGQGAVLALNRNRTDNASPQRVVKTSAEAPNRFLWMAGKRPDQTYGKNGAGSGQASAAPFQNLRGPQARPVLLHVGLVGSNAKTTPQPMDRLPGKTNYLIGRNTGDWRTGISNYARVKYPSVYPGVDLVYYGRHGHLEFDFVVQPGADPKAIRMSFGESTESGIRQGSDGSLIITTKAGDVRFNKPFAYQSSASGRRVNIACRFRLTAPGTAALRLGSYDPAKRLVIDPVLSFSTYLGGTQSDQANAITVDSVGNIYVTGATSSSNFPLANPLDRKSVV